MSWNIARYSKKCPQYHLNKLRKIKEQLNNGNSHYGQWTWRLDTTWMDDELMMDWLMDGCFPLFYLLTYFINGTFPENFQKFSRILFFRKSYNPSAKAIAVFLMHDVIDRSILYK